MRIFSPDGDNFLTDGANCLAIWETETGHLKHQLLGHAKWITCAAYAPDGSFIVSGSVDGSLRVWDAQSGISLRCLEGHESPILAASVSEDCSWIASSSGDPANWLDAGILHDVDRTIRVWDVSSGQQVSVLNLGNEDVDEFVLEVDRGNRHIRFNTSTGTQIWDVASDTYDTTQSTLKSQSGLSTREELRLIRYANESEIRNRSDQVVAFYPSKLSGARYCPRHVTWAVDKGHHFRLVLDDTAPKT